MAGDSPQDPTGTSPNVAEVAEPCPGVSLWQYAEYFKAKGEPSVLSQDGSHAWLPAGKGALYRMPLECMEPVPPATVRQLLRLPRVAQYGSASSLVGGAGPERQDHSVAYHPIGLGGVALPTVLAIEGNGARVV